MNAADPILASIVDIYDALVAGKQLVLEFPSRSNAESFRVSLHKFKRRSDNQMDAVGIDFDKMVLAFGIAPVDVANTSTDGIYPVRVTMCLRARRQTATYKILSISDAPKDADFNAQVRSNLG